MWQPDNKEEFIKDYNLDISYGTLADMYQATENKINHYIRHLHAIGDLPRRSSTIVIDTVSPANAPKSIVVKTAITSTGEHTEERLVNEEIRSKEALMALYQLDPSAWEVIEFSCSQGTWDGFWKNSDNEAQTKTLYRYCCKGRFRPVKPVVKDALADARSLIADAKDYMPSYTTPSRRRNPERAEHCLEIAIPDLHMGKLSWKEETGCENYDVNIAEDLFFQALSSGLDFAKYFDIGRILFPIGNDLLNSDSSSNMTTKGTPQDTDSRQKKTFRRVRKMLVTAIEMMRTIAPVTALTIPGNHDQDTCFYIGDSIQGWLNKADDVFIDNNAYGRKVFQWGKNGILLTHGEEKEADLALTFASDYPELWAATTQHEVHCGHLHTTITRDYRGCQVRYLSALTAPDFWHTTKNYRSKRSASFFIWQKDGLDIYQKTFNARPEQTL